MDGLVGGGAVLDAFGVTMWMSFELVGIFSIASTKSKPISKSRAGDHPPIDSKSRDSIDLTNRSYGSSRQGGSYCSGCGVGSDRNPP